jgi:glycosyltransferase involved in cell wall biosynthesis
LVPLVSVIMPVRDGERFLREALESILDQTMTDLELVVVDDGSDDSTPDILAEYARADDRVVVHRQAAAGQAVARNTAVGIARAGLIAVLDADDVAEPERLEGQVAFLGAHESVAVVGGAVTFIDERGRAFAEGVAYPASDEEIRAALPDTTPIVHSAALVRKSCLLEVGGYRKAMTTAEDLDLWLRIADRHRLANLSETVVRYRMHSGQVTVDKLEIQTLRATAARLAARVRASGGVDPLEGVERIDARTLLALGADQEEITARLVHAATWLALTMGRAGYAQAAEDLYVDTLERARASGSPELIEHVQHEQARWSAERRGGLRGRLRRLRPPRAR